MVSGEEALDFGDEFVQELFGWVLDTPPLSRREVALNLDLDEARVVAEPLPLIDPRRRPLTIVAEGIIGFLPFGGPFLGLGIGRGAEGSGLFVLAGLDLTDRL